jgi:hypothetical protein
MVAQNPGRSRISASLPSKDDLQSMMHKPQEMIQEYPLSSSLVLFGLGIGVGLLISQAVCESTASAFQSANPWRHQPSTMEKLGHSMYQALENVFPESVMQSVHQRFGR